jgi:hypothetical protein
MPDNTDEKHLDNTTNNQSENPSDEVVPIKDKGAINPNQETENMETHAQELHKAPGHGLKHYLFEFLILFLAVFCGFLAENYRENKVEHQRAQELVASLLEDLQHDTAQLNMLIKYRETKKLNLDSLNGLLQSPLETIDRNSFYSNLLYTTQIFLFNQASGTISQLKNAGYLRYFSDDKLIKMISDYEYQTQDFKLTESTELEWTSHKLIDFWALNLDNSMITERLYIINKHLEGTGISFYKPDGLRNLKAILNELDFFNHAMEYEVYPIQKKEACKLMDYLHQQFHLK